MARVLDCRCCVISHNLVDSLAVWTMLSIFLEQLAQIIAYHLDRLLILIVVSQLSHCTGSRNAASYARSCSNCAGTARQTQVDLFWSRPGRSQLVDLSLGSILLHHEIRGLETRLHRTSQAMLNYTLYFLEACFPTI